MTRSPDSFTFPSWLLEEEPHKYLRRFKLSWSKRFRPTRMEELYESVDLANYLVALERAQDAERLLVFVTDLVEFEGNFNTWCPAGAGRMLLARLCRLRGDDDARERALAPIRQNSFNVTPRGELFDEVVSRHAKELDDAAGETQKWACHGLSRHLMGLHLLQETALAGFREAVAGGYDCAELEPLVVESYARLKDHLK